MSDVTKTDAWRKLAELRDSFTPDLRGWFAADPGRVAALTRTAGDLHVDLSKNLVTAPVLDALCDLADAVGLAERRDAMFRGDRINVTEDRSVLHTALRRPPGAVPAFRSQARSASSGPRRTAPRSRRADGTAPERPEGSA